MAGSMPERRSYHSTFVFENKLYIYGGLDIQKGSVSTLWEMDMSLINELEAEESDRRSRC